MEGYDLEDFGDRYRLEWSRSNSDEWWRILEAVKTLEGKWYHPEGQYWTCAKTDNNDEVLAELGFFN